MIRVVLLLQLMWLGAASAANNPLTHCAQQAGSGSEESIALSRDCPQAYRFLSEANQRDGLGLDLSRKLSSEQLDFYRRLLTPKENAHPWQPDLKGLPDLLDEVLVNTKKKEEWKLWDAVVDWLKARDWTPLERLGNWINEMNPSEDALLNTLYVLMGLIVMSAIVVVIRELRASGFFQRRSGAQSRQEDDPTLEGEKSRSSWQKIQEMAAEEQVGALLQWGVAQLMQQDFLPHRPDRTNRELLQQLKRKQPELAMGFARLIDEAEPVIYGGKPVEEQALERMRAQAQSLVPSA
jgi:hypothetical protein